ncbi:MAG TPA: mannose-1-phosphate guanylyltransferase, partial [Candidatus Binatia bacterium]
SGIFVWKASAILEAMESFAPVIHRGLFRIRSETRGKSLIAAGPGARAVLGKVYRRMPDLSVDRGVLERAAPRGRVLTIQADFDWSDVGSWWSLYRVLPHDRQGNAGRGDRLAVDSTDCLVHAPERLVVLLGMRDVMVVDTPDALLVGDIRRSQDVRRVVAELARRDRGRSVQ